MGQNQNGYKYVPQEYNSRYYNPFSSTRCCYDQCYCKDYDRTITITNSIDQSTIANANGGSVGDNGNGGAGGVATATNNAEARVYNVIIIPGRPLGGVGQTHKVDIDGKIMDIKVDKDGNVFINGEQKNKDGPSVFTFENK